MPRSRLDVLGIALPAQPSESLAEKIWRKHPECPFCSGFGYNDGPYGRLLTCSDCGGTGHVDAEK